MLFTPFSNNWKFIITINSIVWYTSIVVSGIIDPGGVLISISKTGAVIDLVARNGFVIIVVMSIIYFVRRIMTKSFKF